MLFDEASLGLKILSQSANDLVVVKPAGMASDLTRDPKRASLISRVRDAVRRAGAIAAHLDPKLVNRLDRVTSGPMIVALSREVAAFYGDQIREGMWEKYYVARVPRPPRELMGPGGRLIGKHKAYIKEGDDRARLVRSGGKVSYLEVLECEPAADFPGEAHVLIRLLTGRLHQIRVMMAGLGMPLTGDELYGGRAGPMYLEHIALWSVDYTTREMRLSCWKDDPSRERLGPMIRKRLGVIEVGPMAWRE
jgi:23S rRNA-/tRNA-specific pseudouridylate synthase